MMMVMPKRIKRVNRYTMLSTTQEGREGNTNYQRGLVISCPFVTVSKDQVHPEMQKYLYLSMGILACTIIVIILIITGALLPPGKILYKCVCVCVFEKKEGCFFWLTFFMWWTGIIDPETNTIRFVSDGFADYRPLPFISLSLLIIMVTLFDIFAYYAVKRNKLPMWMLALVIVSGGISCMGLLFVAIFPGGVVHLTGAGIFISFYVLMQVFMDQILHNIYPGPWFLRIMEYGVVGITILAAFMFGVLILFAAIMGGYEAVFLSGSAIAEYVVFLFFVIMSLYSMSLISYIANWFHEDPKNGQKWIPNSNNDQANHDGNNPLKN